jgi:hypothetical protein
MTLLICKLGGKKCSDQIDSDFFTHDARTETKDIDVIVFHGLMGGVDIMAHTCTNTRNFVCRHTDSDTATANKNPSIGLPRNDGLSHVPGEVRIIHGTTGICPTIHDLVSSG